MTVGVTSVTVQVLPVGMPETVAGLPGATLTPPPTGRPHVHNSSGKE